MSPKKKSVATKIVETAKKLVGVDEGVDVTPPPVTADEALVSSWRSCLQISQTDLLSRLISSTNLLLWQQNAIRSCVGSESTCLILTTR